MARLKVIWGIKIYTETVTTSAAIGLSNGKFQWIENKLAGVSSAWKGGIVYDGAISQLNESTDAKLAGNVSQVRGITVKINNTALFWSTIEGLSININGKKAELIEFVRIDGVTT